MFSVKKRKKDKIEVNKERLSHYGTKNQRKRGRVGWVNVKKKNLQSVSTSLHNFQCKLLKLIENGLEPITIGFH